MSNTYVVRRPITNKIGRQRPEELREDLAVFPRSLLPPHVDLVTNRISDKAVFARVSLILVEVRCRAHGGCNLGHAVLGWLRYDETKMLYWKKR